MSETPRSVPRVEWGRDHWSTFAYMEDVCRRYKGFPDPQRMRCNPQVHPYEALPQHHKFGDQPYPYSTRILEGVVPGHDDWSCLEDFLREGLIEDAPYGRCLTEKGYQLANTLTTFLANGGTFSTFRES